MRILCQQTILVKYHALFVNWKGSKIWNCRLLQIEAGALWANNFLIFNLCLFDLILYLPVNNFSVICWDRSSSVEPVLSKDRTQHSDAGDAQTHGPSISSQALYHWATALPYFQPDFHQVNAVKLCKMPVFSNTFTFWCAFFVSPLSVKKKMHLKMLYAEVVCCK